ncbi:MAG: ribonuclease HII [Candidatus Omnitrophota bacterium]|jgi:ribonuclease HII
MTSPHLNFEKEVWAVKGLACGIDEVGRGCIAGPVVAAAVVFDPEHSPHEKIKDSKMLTPKKREELYDFILEEAQDYGIGLVPASVIDEIGIVPATKKAMQYAIEMLGSDPSSLLIDAVVLSEVDIPQKSIIKGDTVCYSIAAASIIAKVFRDHVVIGFDNIYPEYGFSGHKGYGASTHYAAIEKHGLTPEHRRTFLRKLEF